MPPPPWRYSHGPVSWDLSRLWRVSELEMLPCFESRRFVRTGTGALSGRSLKVRGWALSVRGYWDTLVGKSL